MEYIPRLKVIGAGATQRLILDVKPKYTYGSSCTMEKISELYVVEKLPKGTLTINLKTIELEKI